jgi:hypothetical protein
MLHQKRLHGAERLLGEDGIQNPPFPGMEARVCPSDGVKIMLIPGHHVVEVGSLDVGLGVEDISICIRGSEEDPIGTKADHISIDLVVACDPHMAVTCERPVKIRDGRNLGEKRSRILG